MQTKLDMFISKKTSEQKGTQRQPTVSVTKRSNVNKIPRQEQHHASSRQHSQTQMMEPEQQKSQAYQKEIIKNTKTCCNMILPGPSDSIYFHSIMNKLKNLRQSYNPNNKQVFFDYLQQNLKFQGVKNVENVKKIYDNIFWKRILPKMITLVIEKHEKVSACICTLTLSDKVIQSITRQQILIILISMFLGIMPKNSLSRNKSFGEWMTRKDKQKSTDLKVQKLKFIVNYFIMAIQKMQESPQFGEEIITFQKSISNTYEMNKCLDTDDYSRHIPMLDVEFVEEEKDKEMKVKIEDYYGRAAMVDFANIKIGGGVLRNGCVQEEILFLIFPEAIMSILITDQMKQNQAIIMYGLRRYNNYKGYSYTTQFDGPFQDNLKDINSSVMIAMDAIDFNGKMEAIQYFKDHTIREIIKAHTGFNGIQYAAGSDMNICTGRWGCGAFKGDEIWKFFIQWIASSEAGRSMIYVSDQKQIVEELKQAVKQLINKGSLDILGLMEGYTRARKKDKFPVKHTFIDYLKSHA